ncbi:MAG: hypothetical protein JJE17_05930 [Peptostreptococcaceae bacterium]|nr:hypothetical protein [Peptostreptococcaceae bacterium]
MKINPFVSYFLIIITLIVLSQLPITKPLMFALGTIYQYGIYIFLGGVAVIALVALFIDRK